MTRIMNLKDEIIRLRKEGKTYKEIKKILKCSFSTISYHCRRTELNDYNKVTKICESIIEQIPTLYEELKSTIKVAKKLNISKSSVLKYFSVPKKRMLTDDELKENNKISVTQWRRRTKILLVEYKGGKCSKCGYNKCIDALEFHHLNPDEKDFSISGIIKSFNKLKSEVDKCILVCSNCHREIHSVIKNEGDHIP